MSENTAGPETISPDAASAWHRLAAIAERIRSFRREIRPELEEAVNGYLGSQSPQTIDEKKEIASRVNGLLKEFGFTIEHSGQTCSLYVLGGPHEPRGRFRIQPRTSKPVAASSLLADLLPLTITDVVAPRKPRANKAAPTDGWRHKVTGDEADGPAR